MFNNKLKKEAFKLHEGIYKEYNDTYLSMSKSCECLYGLRCDSVSMIKTIEQIINSIANTPKEFDTKMSEVKKEITKFISTEEYAREAYEMSLKTGVNIAGGAAAGMGIATMAPTALMSIATTFGTASTGTAIRLLSGAAAKKAAVAWIGRTFAGFAVKEGAGLLAGEAFLALAGPLGWGISAVSTGVSLLSLNKNNKKIADDAISEAKDIARANEALKETIIAIDALLKKTKNLLDDMNLNKDKIISYTNLNYSGLSSEDKLFLASIVNNTLSLSALLNETIR